jgi:cobalamin-dependent methionine synthase I
MEIPKNDFESVFTGEGRNEIDSPIKLICQLANCLALFAVTVGKEVCSEISLCFNKNDFALGSMLDSAASEGTEMTAQAIEDIYRRHLIETGKFNSDSGILRFSPGYCGWHISAQRKLFQTLRPEEIRITLNDSFLMQPLKSISGVIIFGRKKIFDFEDNFSFCIDCNTHTCRDRVQTVNKH